MAGSPGMARNVGLRAVCFPQDDVIGYVVGEQGMLLKTEDGGDSWRQMDVPVQYAGFSVIRFPVDTENGVCVGSAGTIMRTNDGGLSWLTVYADTNEDLLGLDFRASGGMGCCCGRNGTILLTTDSGLSWVRAESVEL